MVGNELHDAVLAAVASAVRDAILRVRPDGIVRQASARVSWVTGLAPAAVEGRPLAALFDPAHASAVAGLIAAAVREDRIEPGLLELRLAARRDQATWVEVSATPVADAVGRVAEVVVVLHDVTDRRRGRRRAVQQAELIEAVTTTTPIGIVALDGDVLTYANPRVEELIGLDRQQLRLHGLAAVMTPDDRARFAQDRAAWRGRTDRDPVEGAYRIVLPDGEERWLRLRLSPLRQPAADAWAGTVEDVTNEVTARQHSALLAMIVSAGTDVVAILAPDGRVRFLNPAGRALLGLPAAGGIGELHAQHLFDEATWTRLRTDVIPGPGGGTWSGDGVLRAGDGQPIPVSLALVLHRDAIGGLDRVSIVARDTSVQQAREQHLEQAASRDPLTGLPNRAQVVKVVGAALEGGDPASVAVLFCDLDRFKAVNDSLGHEAGDQLLRVVADRLARVLRTGDVAGRLGGDEFVVVATGVQGPEDVRQLGERIREVLDAPVQLDASPWPVRVTSSVGCALALREDSPQALIARADEAMYAAKRRGKDRVELYDAADEPAHLPSLVVGRTLELALEQQELELQLQPIVDLADGRVVGAEALVRWPHPELGLLTPADFLSVAEESGLTTPIGRWVLREAVGIASTWATDPSIPAGLRLHVNVSQHHLAGGRLPEDLGRLIAETGLPPGMLCLELLDDLPGAAVDPTEVAALHALGVLVGIDDAVTGSAARLGRHPIDLVKLDVSAVRHGADPAAVVADPAAAVAEGVCRTAGLLGVDVVAVGVEEPAQAAVARALGCRFAQGLLYAGPAPVGDVVRMLREGGGTGRGLTLPRTGRS